MKLYAREMNPAPDIKRSLFDPSSLRWRLQLWHALILAGVITALCLLAWRLAALDRHERIDHELETFEHSFIRHVFERMGDSAKNSSPPTSEEIQKQFTSLRNDPSSFPLHMRGLFDQSASDGIYLVFWDGEGRELFRSANAPHNIAYPTKNEDRDARGGRYFDGRRELIRGGPQGAQRLVGRDISSDMTALRRLALQIGISGTSLWIIGLLGGWWLAGRAIQPISAISKTASRIAGGKVSERIDIEDTDNELGRLSHVLNETFDRLENAIERQRQFTADASHELRNPLTVILSETSRGLKRDRDAEAYREILSTCHDAGTRMRSLVESLLMLARQDGEHEFSFHEPLDLSEIVQDSLRLLQPLAETKDTTIQTYLEPVLIDGDTRGLSILVNNLVSNAIVHQKDGGQVIIRVWKDEQNAFLTVADKGDGIPEQHLPRVFDRFYRVDPARGQTTGHSGLGLAIAKAIVENHHGEITVFSKIAEGTEFTVQLPLHSA